MLNCLSKRHLWIRKELFGLRNEFLIQLLLLILLLWTLSFWFIKLLKEHILFLQLAFAQIEVIPIINFQLSYIYNFLGWNSSLCNRAAAILSLVIFMMIINLWIPLALIGWFMKLLGSLRRMKMWRARRSEGNIWSTPF